jgi:glycosyltransferase involved in cell wall biosynthesis
MRVRSGTPAEGEKTGGECMYNGKSIAVVIPSYNVATQLGQVIGSMPAFVDIMIVVDDSSTDGTLDIAMRLGAREAPAPRPEAVNDRRLFVIRHSSNQGVGGAIASGYQWCRDAGIDLAVVMAGDGQMDPTDLERIIAPVASGEVDYTKGNRLFTGEAWKKIPRIRYLGNSVLSLFTKIASGYWHIADSQSGYTAISKKALSLIDWDKMYRRYGQPNDLLVRLNVYSLKVRDVLVNPVYHIGERSGIRVGKVIFTISWLLVRMFLWRIKEKYVIRDFHPLVFFYLMAFALLLACFPLCGRMVYYWRIAGEIPKINFLSLMLCIIMGFQSLFFAMLFDMQNNRDLR